MQQPQAELALTQTHTRAGTHESIPFRVSAAEPEIGRGIRAPCRGVLPGVPVLRALIRSAIVALVAVSSPIHAFDFDDVGRRAAVLASRSYEAPPQDLPKVLRELSYDAYRDIRFKPSRALWRGMNLPFEVQMFHRGMHYDQAVRISEIVAGVPREIRFDPELFDYGSNRFDPAQTRGAGFAGFRVHFALNTPKYKDEVLVFLGASYFRALGKDQRYGISARGLAIDTALASGEEFPHFIEFWIERPSAVAKELTIYALLDSRSVAGAYRFVLRPGIETVTLVKARLFLRNQVAKLGIAPLTTMFFSGENQRANNRDYRPEVHDSDLLLIQSGTGEWIMRPLVNPKRLLVTSFALSNPQGFGLMQYDRSFASYQDLEARYDLRPSAWIEPRGNWGNGRIELVQLPIRDETNDNVVAFWVPEALPPPRMPLDVEYVIRWQKNNETRPPLAYVTQSRRGHGYTPEPDPSIGFVIDFEGPVFKSLAPDALVESVVTVDKNGTIVENHVYRNEVTGGMRLRLRIAQLDDKKPVEIRAFLRTAEGAVTPTWSYIVPVE
jgi:glucans biosynthesis protein